MAHDQPDNAARLSRLGVAKVISPRRFRARRIARVINSLLDDRNYYVRCHWVAQWFKGQRPLNETADALEELGERRRAEAPEPEPRSTPEPAIATLVPSPGTPRQGHHE
jgi:UDP:flavonoid glycosyltransferase YjiC (YdhE family)